jgi:hypothetical protein
MVRPLEFDVYAGLQRQASRGITVRDADDWPVLACAMTLGCPVWTEDADFWHRRGDGPATGWRCFFGKGDAFALATWRARSGRADLIAITTHCKPNGGLGLC